MDNKIINYLIENFGCEEIDNDAAMKFIKENCNNDDCVEFANLLVYIENINKELCQFIFNRI